MSQSTLDDARLSYLVSKQEEPEDPEMACLQPFPTVPPSLLLHLPPAKQGSLCGCCRLCSQTWPLKEVEVRLLFVSEAICSHISTLAGKFTDKELRRWVEEILHFLRKLHHCADGLIRPESKKTSTLLYGQAARVLSWPWKCVLQSLHQELLMCVYTLASQRKRHQKWLNMDAETSPKHLGFDFGNGYFCFDWYIK